MSDQEHDESAKKASSAKTLRDDDIISADVSRRAAVRVVGAGIVAAAGLAAGATPAAAQVTDQDQGPNADPAGRGRGNRGGGGKSDQDQGPNADPPGRGNRGGVSVTDTDRGPDQDPSGRGRGGRSTPYTDRDRGPKQDPPGRGRLNQRSG